MLYVTIVALAFGIVVLVHMRTEPRFPLSSVPVVTRVAHSFGVVFSAKVWTFIHLIDFAAKEFVVVSFGDDVVIFVQVLAEVGNCVSDYLVLNVLVNRVVQVYRLEDILPKVWLKGHVSERCSYSTRCRIRRLVPSDCRCSSECGRLATLTKKLRYLVQLCCCPVETLYC